MAFIGNEPLPGSFRKINSLNSSFNNTTATFTMTVSVGDNDYNFDPGTSFNLLVVKNGSPLEPEVEFTISGTSITFDATPLTTDDVFIVSYGEPVIIGTPDDGAVTGGAFKPGSISYNKLTQSAKDSIIANTITFGI